MKLNLNLALNKDEFKKKLDLKDGLDGSPDTPDQVVEKVNESSLLIRPDRIQGLADAIKNMLANAVPVTTSFFNGLRAKNLTIVGGTAELVGDTVQVTVSGAGGSGITRSVNNISVNTNAGATAATDYEYNISGTKTLTMPTAIGNTNRYSIKSVTGSNTVATTSAQTIDGTTTIVIAVGDSVDLTSDGANWVIK